MNDSDKSATAPKNTAPSASLADERRQTTRRPAEYPVEVDLDISHITGTSQNLSTDGICLFTDQPVTVTVRVMKDGQPIELKGKVLRTESVTQELLAIAVRFAETQDLQALGLQD